MTNDRWDYIFEWYYRGRQVADRSPGEGLGLPTAREIVDQHGGTITVSSRPGAGSTFTVHLPVSTHN